MVRAKFKVHRIEASMSSKRVETEDGIEYVPAEMRTVVFMPVTGGSEENKRFWDYTPAGEIHLGTINESAWSAFSLGQEYYVDFTPAE